VLPTFTNSAIRISRQHSKDTVHTPSISIGSSAGVVLEFIEWLPEKCVVLVHESGILLQQIIVSFEIGAICRNQRTPLLEQCIVSPYLGVVVAGIDLKAFLVLFVKGLELGVNSVHTRIQAGELFNCRLQFCFENRHLYAVPADGMTAELDRTVVAEIVDFILKSLRRSDRLILAILNAQAMGNQNQSPLSVSSAASFPPAGDSLAQRAADYQRVFTSDSSEIERSIAAQAYFSIDNISVGSLQNAINITTGAVLAFAAADIFLAGAPALLTVIAAGEVIGEISSVGQVTTSVMALFGLPESKQALCEQIATLGGDEAASVNYQCSCRKRLEIRRICRRSRICR